MIVDRLKQLLHPTGFALFVSCLVWYVVLEFHLFVFSTRGLAFQDYLQPPYKERIEEYVVGTREESLDNYTVADQLYLKVRIHCLLHLTNDHERRKAKHILKTWGTRCNRMHISEGPSTTKAYRRIAKTQYEDLDWLLHVHVDSYVIMENLRFKLASYNPAELLQFNAYHRAYPYAHVSLRNSTDYIFSRGSLQYLLQTPKCLGKYFTSCMTHMTEGPNEQLFPFQVPPEVLPFTLRTSFWVWPFIHRAVYNKQGFNSSIGMPIILPYAATNQFYELEYFLYHLRSYGFTFGMPGLPRGSVLEVPALPENDTVSKQLQKQVRILCMLLVYPHRYEQVVRSIQRSWGRHCNKLIVFSSRVQESFPGIHTVALNVSEGYNLLWSKTKAAFKHVYTHYLGEADWFYKADHDTYAILDNMRLMLLPHHVDHPIYFGCKFQPEGKTPYMSGGAGYVLNRGALRRLVEDGFQKNLCGRAQRGAEDVQIGTCLLKCNVTLGDSIDSNGRHRFLPLSLRHMMIPGSMEKDHWLHKYISHQIKQGMECCSRYAISIHYVSHFQMLLFEHFLYKMCPYGIITGH